MTNFKDTVFLPQTSLPIKAKVSDELTILQSWEGMYANIKAEREGRLPFVLHDGPPYANGNIHIGHALNKILKDIVVRTRTMFGFNPTFVAGWDCHGLPIEWKVEEEWRAAKKDKNADPESFRNDCRAYASGWIETQKQQFKRLGINADWDNHYTTMDPKSEITILSAFHRLVEAGKVNSENKPTLWSPAEKTALAEAETVDQTHTVPTIYVKFKMTSGPLANEQASLLVWTTTPWSLPGNVAVAFNEEISYGLYQTGNDKFVIADDLAHQALNTENIRLRTVDVTELFNQSCSSPLGNGYPIGHEHVSVIPASFVKNTTGTGLVHIGPSHSVEDWGVWNGSYPNVVNQHGVYEQDIPVFGGIAVTKGKKLGPANAAVIHHMTGSDTLYRVVDQEMTLQHSWRSDAVLLMRATPQWFIDLEQDREAVLETLAPINFTPYSAKARLFNMLQTRPNWLISRQRLWGTPLALLLDENGEPCRDSVVLTNIQNVLQEKGTEYWYKMSVDEVVQDGKQYTKLNDVMDVWFDSGEVQLLMDGTSSDFVIEGVDQTRGWFQSSLLASVLDPMERQAPYKNVLTHGFVLDQHGKKMSKSAGNVIDPMTIVDKYGADALRVWVASSDWQHDIRVSEANIKNCAETVRKIRNTLRYMVGALSDYTPMEIDHIPELEQYILHRTFQMDNGENSLSKLLADNKFTTYLNNVLEYCQFISSFWFDVRKDTLYCDDKNNPVRLAYQSVLASIFELVTRWISPIMPFASDEVWKARFPHEKSIHQQTWYKAHDPDFYHNLDKWDSIMEIRTNALAELEKHRTTFKSSAETKLVINVRWGSAMINYLQGIDLAELLMVSEVVVMPCNPSMVEHYSFTVEPASKTKCERCWKYAVDDGSELCHRCDEIVSTVE